MTFLKSPYASFSLLQQNWHADLEFACKFCFLVHDIAHSLELWRSNLKCEFHSVQAAVRVDQDKTKTRYPYTSFQTKTKKV